jgi:anti-anti-sigma factor
MVAPPHALDTRQALALNLQYTRGRHGAAARIELHDGPAGRFGSLAIRGWVDPAAGRRIEQTLDDLASRDVRQLLVDCSQLRHIDYRVVSRLLHAIARFESRNGSVALCGMSRYLQDVFRLSGGDPPVAAWPPPADDVVPAAASGPVDETAS